MDLLDSPDFTYRTSVNHPQFRQWIRGIDTARGADPAASYAIGSPEYFAALSAINSERAVFDRVKEDMRLLYEDLVKREIEIVRKTVLISPIKSLPLEVLGRIFTFLPPARFPEGSRQRFAIMSVCRMWYDVIINTPEMWRYINWPASPGTLLIRSIGELHGPLPIPYPHIPYSSGPTVATPVYRIAPLKGLVQWMEKAKAVDLDVELRIGRGMEPAVDEATEAPAAEVNDDTTTGVEAGSSQQIPTIQVVPRASSTVSQLTRGVVHILSRSPSFRNLKVLIAFSHSDMLAWAHLMSALKNATRLRSLSLDPTLDRGQPEYGFGHMYPPVLPSPGGEDKELRVFTHFLRQQHGVENITLSSLTSLVVRGATLYPFFEFISAPSLLSLEVNTTVGHPADPCRALVALSKRFPILQSLKLICVRKISQDTGSSSEALELSHLRLLELENCDLPRQFQSFVIGSASILKELKISSPCWISAVRDGEQPLPFLPNLETLYIKISLSATGTANHPSWPPTPHGYMPPVPPRAATNPSAINSEEGRSKPSAFISVPSLKHLKFAFAYGSWFERLTYYLSAIVVGLLRDAGTSGGEVICSKLEDIEWLWNMDWEQTDKSYNRVIRTPRSGTHWEVYKRLLASCLLVASARRLQSVETHDDPSVPLGKAKGKAKEEPATSLCKFTLKRWHCVFPDLENVSIEGLLDAFAMLPDSLPQTPVPETSGYSLPTFKVPSPVPYRTPSIHTVSDGEADDVSFDEPEPLNGQELPVGYAQYGTVEQENPAVPMAVEEGAPAHSPASTPSILFRARSWKDTRITELPLSLLVAAVRSELNAEDRLSESPLDSSLHIQQDLLNFSISHAQEAYGVHYADAFESATKLRPAPHVFPTTNNIEMDRDWGVMPQW